MADNQFSVRVPNVLEALMAGEQGYKDVQGYVQQNQQKQVREQAAQEILQGGNPQNALARLLSIGDDKGAGTLASVIAQRAQQDYQNKALAETSRFHSGSLAQQAAQSAEASRHNKAIEGIQAEAQNKPMILPFGSGLVGRDGTVIKEPSGEASLDPKTLDFMARQYMAGDTSVLTNLGRGAQGAQNVVALRKRIAELNAETGAGGGDQAVRNAEYFGTKAGQRTLGTRSANIELAATEFDQVLPVVQAASKAVNRTNYPSLNSVIQAWEKGTGDKNIVAFAGGVNTLINLYARAISPSGVATVSDKDHAREILDKAWSQGQFDAAVGMMKQEIDAALASPEKVRQDMRKRFLGGQPGAQPAAPPSQPAATPGIPAPPPGFQLVK